MFLTDPVGVRVPPTGRAGSDGVAVGFGHGLGLQGFHNPHPELGHFGTPEINNGGRRLDEGFALRDEHTLFALTVFFPELRRCTNE